MKNYIKLLRVRHYIKNLLVLAALICSGQMVHLSKLLSVLIGFVAFCAISSSVYIINDIRDREKDRLHPAKCCRPIASGAISVNHAWSLAVLMISMASSCNIAVFRLSSTSLLVLYLMMNLAYSFGLKNVPLADISILAAGFLIRVLYGACITDITVSSWLYLTILSLAFYCALGKRRNELRQIKNDSTRNVLKYYTVNFLDKNMYMCLGLANAFYALWCMDEKTKLHYHNDYLLFTVPLVLLITMKYSLNVEEKSEGDPVEVLLNDKTLVVMCILQFSFMLLSLYF